MVRSKLKTECLTFGVLVILTCLICVVGFPIWAKGAEKLTTPQMFRLSEQTPNSVKLTWKTVSGADGYQIYRSEKRVGGYQKVKTIRSGTSTSWRDYGRVPQKVYYYKIRAFKKGATQNTYSQNSLTVKAKIPTAVEKYGKLSVKGSRLVDKNKKMVQLKGVSSHGMSWYPQYLNEKAFRTMRDEWGVQVVRLAMYTAEYNGYCVGNDQNRKLLRNRIDEAVLAAEKLGMYVIIDWHILSDNNPQTYQAQAIQFFKTMAKRYAAKEHVIYEICNEPNGSTSWSQIKSYAKPVIKAIRTYDKDGIIIVGTPTWSQDVDQAVASPITGYDNLMYALHFYADTHRDSLRVKLKNAVNAGLPVFVTEYGICDASGSGPVNPDEAGKWMQLLDDCQISSCIWNLSNKAETSAMLKPDCKKTYGWKKADLSSSGSWFVKMMQGSLTTLGTVNANISAHGAGYQAEVVEQNSWGNGTYCTQYALRLKNSGEKNIQVRKIVMSFSDTITLESGWCGKFCVNGKTLTITPETYNEQIQAGESTDNIGFIVKGKRAPKLVRVTCQ